MKRAEKMILAAGAGVVCVGLVLSLAAFAMGGRPASMVVERDGIEVRRNESGNVAFGMIQGSSDDTQKVPSAPSVADESANSPSVAQVDGWTEYELPSSDRFDIESGMCELVVKTGEAGSAPVLRVQNIQENWVRWKQDEGWLEIELCTDLHGLQVPEDAKAELILPPDSTTGLKLKSEMSGIQVSGFTLEKLEADAELGGIEITDTTAQNASFSAEMGNVIFTGNLTGYIEADTEMGSVELNIPRPQQYSWQVETEMGSVTIDGQEFGAGARQKNGNTAPVFDLETEMGSITVNFS